jgi:hypothetical protein
MVWPYSPNWREALGNWLSGWLGEEASNLILSNLSEPAIKKEVAFPAPGVPTGFCLRIRGIGTVKSDRTPWREGTLEYEYDPEISERIEALGAQVSARLAAVEAALLGFAEQIEAHLSALRGIEAAVSELRAAIADFQRAVEGLKG